MTESAPSRGAAFVTGAAGTIGRSIVPTLARDGVRVIAVDRDDPTPHFPDLVAGGTVVPVTADLGSAEGRAAAVDAGRAAGRVQYLVNNAADGSTQSLLESTDDDWHRILETNLVAPAALVRMLADDLSGGGVVINISSVRGLRCLPGAAPYEASKSGLLALTRTIASEMGGLGVRAVSICPGAIVDDPDTWMDEIPDDMRQAWEITQPHGKAGGADAIAEMIAFLCSDRGYHVNGVEIVVDGGAMAQYPVTPALRLTGWLDRS